jgi:hypothetical protein
MATYTAEERKRLESALAADRMPDCPACGSRVTARRVEPPRAVSYVRHRVLVLCPACRRRAAIDVGPAVDP